MAERSPHSSALLYRLLAGDGNGSFTPSGTQSLRRLPPLAHEVAEGLARQESARWQASGSRRELSSQQITTFEFTISTSTLITQHSRIQQLQPQNVSQAAFHQHQVTREASEGAAQQCPNLIQLNIAQLAQKMQPARARQGHHSGVMQQHAAEAHGSMPDFENPTKLGDLVAGSDSAKRPPPMKQVRLPWLCDHCKASWTSRACSKVSSMQAKSRARLARAQAQAQAKAQAQSTSRRVARHYTPEHLARSQVSELYAGSIPMPARQLSLLCALASLAWASQHALALQAMDVPFALLYDKESPRSPPLSAAVLRNLTLLNRMQGNPQVV